MYDPNPDRYDICSRQSMFPYGPPDKKFYSKWSRDYKISLTLPTRGRIDLLSQCLCSFYYRASGNIPFEFVLIVDFDDHETIDFIRSFICEHKITNISCVLVYRSLFIQRDYNNLSVNASSGDLIFMLNDDVEMMTDCWDEIIHNKYLEVKVIDDIHLLAVMDNSHNGDGRGACFPVLTKTFVNIFNGAFPPDIFMWGADHFINNVFIAIGRKHVINNVSVIHHACHGEAKDRDVDEIHHHVQHVLIENRFSDKYDSLKETVEILKGMIR
jgi:hypothetical protein